MNKVASRLGSPNVTPPEWLVALTPLVPQCFTARSWVLWLDGVRTEAVAKKNTRRALERGGLPNYCRECDPAHQAAMQAAGRCHPPQDTIDLETDDAAV